MHDVETHIKQLLVSRLRIPAEVLTRADSGTCLLGRGIGLDSMEALALAVALEEAFDIEIADADLTAALFATLGSITEYVRGHIANGRR